METDVLIIGGGIAGTINALRLAVDSQRQITLITRAAEVVESSSYYAQGGIVARGNKDSAESLAEDIRRAGAGISYTPAVSVLAEQGPALVQEILIEIARVPFDQREDGDFAYGLEGAHSHRRVLHVSDQTGKAIMTALTAEVRKRNNIQVLTQHTAIDLITFPHHAKDPFAIYHDPICLGAYVFDQEKRSILPIVARHTVLSSGGLGRIYLNTTNPPGIRGDGIAMAYRAGARIINAEYVQFHPTALYTRGNTRFLISEAVRGEGARLLTPDGQPFMEKYAPEWKDLAPRDIVARAIYWEMLSRDYPYVLLDLASTKSPSDIKERFPQIYQNCLRENVDITREPIPVVPAAHYFCGGVQVDLEGRSTIPGLYAIGEVSCTGVHGANRLASTSLLEGVVWGTRAADHIRTRKETHPFYEDDIKPWSLEGLIYEPDPALIQGDMKNLQNLMWHYVGLVRNNYRMKRADRDLRYLRHEIEDFYRKTTLSDDLIGLRNAIQAAQIVTYAAIRNRTSRGAHYRED